MRRFEANKKIMFLYDKIKNKNASYRDANEFAIEVGECLEGAFATISAKDLPDGRMYYNIAERILNTTMRNNYYIISEVTEQVQKALNERANIGIKAIKPELNQSRIESIINKIANTKNYEDVAWLLESPMVNFSLSIVDDAVRANVEFQYKVGLNPRIVRTATSNCCEWCKLVAGVYDYEKVMNKGNDVFRRHNNCRCIVEYDPRDGRYQNVHTKQWRERDAVEAREHRIEKAKEFLEKKKTATQARRQFLIAKR